MHRCDFDQTSKAAVTIMNRPHRESGEERAEPCPFQQYQKWHPVSSSDSWWNWGHVQKLVELMSSIFFQLFVALGFAYSWWRSAVTYG